MPTTFKNLKPIQIRAKTPQEDLILCTECGGLQAMAQTSIRLDCDNCSGTGYENYYQTFNANASYRPGSISRWNQVEGRVDFFGDCSIKLDYSYKSLIDRASHILMDGILWKFQLLREPGEAMGQKRIVLLLSRK